MRTLQPKTELADMALAALREAILDGELAPGAPLGQEAVAERLGVSRQPVAQALAALKREGLAVDRGRRGLVVAPVSARQIRELYAVRGALEALAAGEAARRGVEADALERELADGAAAVAAGGVPRMIAADMAFHARVYALSGNAEIGRAAAAIWPHLRRVMTAVLRKGRKPERAWNEHRAIAAAIRAWVRC